MNVLLASLLTLGAVGEVRALSRRRIRGSPFACKLHLQWFHFHSFFSPLSYQGYTGREQCCTIPNFNCPILVSSKRTNNIQTRNAIKAQKPAATLFTGFMLLIIVEALAALLTQPLGIHHAFQQNRRTVLTIPGPLVQCLLNG